jgi:hypothetical protein
MYSTDVVGVSPMTSPPAMTRDAWCGAVQDYGYEASWPTTPTGAPMSADDYFAMAHYHQHYMCAATATVVGGTHYYDMPQPYRPHTSASPVSYAAPTAIVAMPDAVVTTTSASHGHPMPQPTNWTGFAYATHMPTTTDCAVDLTFSAAHMATMAMPQPMAFYAY